jgi:hypothetical protein
MRLYIRIGYYGTKFFLDKNSLTFVNIFPILSIVLYKYYLFFPSQGFAPQLKILMILFHDMVIKC